MKSAPGPLNRLAIGLVHGYQVALSPILGGQCRFYPSCSQYAIECFEIFPFWKAAPKAAWRILRCNPLSRGYFDPVVPGTEESGRAGTE